MGKSETTQCLICGQTKPTRNGTIGEVVRPSLSEFIRKKAPQWTARVSSVSTIWENSGAIT